MRRRRRGRRRRNRKKSFLLWTLSILLTAGVAGGIIFLVMQSREEQTEEFFSGILLGFNSCSDLTLKEAEKNDEWIGKDRPEVRGIYVTGPMAGSSSFEQLLSLVDETELNTMVIDVKNDQGEITFQMELEEAQEAGACVRYIQDMPAFMKTLKEHGIYTIARIPCFKDPYLAAYSPELALKKSDGTPVTDSNGLEWVNPYKEGVWEYLVKIAIEAGKLGFDEIQFDYVRFPIGSDAEQADYGVDMENYTKEQAICAFLSYAVEELHKEQLVVSADVFGTIIGSETDVKNVGQDYVKLSEIVDVISPMVYPSHYANQVFGIPVPDAKPYDTVLAAMQDSEMELAGIVQEDRAVVRPWLQAFTATWVTGHISYGGEEIREQIQAVYDAGYREWILWNASNRYVQDGLLPASGEGTDAPEPQDGTDYIPETVGNG